MSHRTRKTPKRMSTSRRLNLECLEPRLCLSTYTTVDLIPLAGHDYSIALGVNDNSLAVGRSHSPDSSEKAAVVWSIDPSGVASVFTLPSVDGDPYAGVHGTEVNNNGMIAGEALIPPEDPTDPNSKSHNHAVVWTGTPGNYVAHDLGTLGGDFVWSKAASISEPDTNGHVWVVGTSATGSDVETPMRHAVLWQVDAAGNVLSTTDLEPNASEVWANDVKVIGNSVFVAGDFPRDPPTVRACVWEADLNGAVVGRTDLGTDDFRAVTAYALNHDGDVAGYGYNSALERHGYLDQVPYESGDGSITDLGSLGNQGSRGQGINDHDVVVGRYYDVKPPNSIRVGQEYAFVWENGVMHKLFDQVSDRTFWLLWTAQDINNHGEIVGIGAVGKRNDSEQHGFLARPEDTTEQHAPVANPDAYAIPLDTTLDVTAPGVLGNDTDADGDSLQATLVPDSGPGNAQYFSFNADGSFTYTPSPNFTGTDSFTYVANDGTTDSNVATVTITVNAVEPPQISITDVSKREGRDGKTATFTFTVTRSGDTSEAVSIWYATADDTAKLADEDYIATSGWLTFAEGETTKTISMTVNGDSTREEDEFFFLRLSLTDVDLTAIATGVGKIINDDK